MDKEDRRVPGLSLKPPTPDKSRALSGNPFMKGDLVSVACDNAGSDGTTSQFVFNGVVRDVFENVNVMGKDCNSAIGVVEMSSDSKELGYIKWNGKAYGAFPDTEYGRVKMICKGYEELTSDQKRTFSVLRSHVRMRKDPGAPMLDSEFDKVMLDEGLCYVIRKLSQKAGSNELIHTVTDGDRDCAMYLAYLFATIQGFQSGLVIKPPKFPHSIPQSLVVAKKRVQRDKSVQRDEGDLLKIARATGNLAITPNNSAFGGKKGLKKCGTNKAKMTEEIVREIGNKAIVLSEEDFGYVPSEQARRPIMLFKHESNADEWLNTGTSLLCLVDGLKDRQERPLGRPGGAAQATTVIECARQILYWAVKQYVKEGVSMVVVFWDIESTSPCERDIQRRKRSKDQSQASSFAAAMNGADFNTPLDHLGTWDFLRDHGKATFMPFLASAVAEAMSVDEGNWSFGELLPPRVAFAFVGGTEPSQRRVYRGPTAHPEESINLTDEVSIEANVVDDILSNAAHQGEAERMLFFFQDRILDHTATNTTEGLAVSTSFDVHCEDTDAVAGIAAPFILRQQARFRRANMKYSGCIMLRIHNKSDSFANHMGTLVQERDGSRVLGTASGEQLVCYFDLLAMYHFFEKDNRLPEFGETGHRAVSVLWQLMS